MKFEDGGNLKDKRVKNSAAIAHFFIHYLDESEVDLETAITSILATLGYSACCARLTPGRLKLLMFDFIMDNYKPNYDKIIKKMEGDK